MAEYLITGNSNNYTIKPWSYHSGAYVEHGGDTLEAVHLKDYYTGAECNVTVELDSNPSMGRYFEGHTELKNMDGGNIKNSDCTKMFQGCWRLKDFTTKFPNLTIATNMFFNSGVERIPESVNFSKATDVSGVFEDCGYLTEVSEDDANFSSAVNARRMFYSCPELQSVDLILPKAEDVSEAIARNLNLTTAYLSIPKATNTTDLFARLPNLTSLKIDGFPESESTVLDFNSEEAGVVESLSVEAQGACFSNAGIPEHQTPARCTIIPSYDFLKQSTSENLIKKAIETVGFTVAGYPFQWYDASDNTLITDDDKLAILSSEDAYVTKRVEMGGGTPVEVWKDENGAEYSEIPDEHYDVDGDTATSYTYDYSHWSGESYFSNGISYYYDSESYPTVDGEVTSVSPEYTDDLADATMTVTSTITFDIECYVPDGTWTAEESDAPDIEYFSGQSEFYADPLPESSETDVTYYASYTGSVHSGYTYGDWSPNPSEYLYNPSYPNASIDVDDWEMTESYDNDVHYPTYAIITYNMTKTSSDTRTVGSGQCDTLSLDTSVLSSFPSYCYRPSEYDYMTDTPQEVYFDESLSIISGEGQVTFTGCTVTFDSIYKSDIESLCGRTVVDINSANLEQSANGNWVVNVMYEYEDMMDTMSYISESCILPVTLNGSEVYSSIPDNDWEIALSEDAMRNLTPMCGSDDISFGSVDCTVSRTGCTLSGSVDYNYSDDYSRASNTGCLFNGESQAPYTVTITGDVEEEYSYSSSTTCTRSESDRMEDLNYHWYQNSMLSSTTEYNQESIDVNISRTVDKEPLHTYTKETTYPDSFTAVCVANSSFPTSALPEDVRANM